MDFTHFDESGNAVMVDVGGKDITSRRAVAEGHIKMSAECFEAVRAGTSKKGDVLGTARLAGIMAAKQTSGLIPLCHPVSITGAGIDFELSETGLSIKTICTVKTDGRTGVEMEALTGVSVALLTIYDMCKAIDRSMVISSVRLLEKSGGKSGLFRAGADE